MAKLNGFEIKGSRILKGEDQSVLKISSLYLGPTKIATILDEAGVPECDSSVQVLVRHPYQDGKLRKVLSALHPDREAYGPEELVQELKWMEELEKEYIRHTGKPNGGMLSLNMEGGQVNLGIPLKFAQAEEEVILASCQPMFTRYQALYGQIQGYLIFHSLGDFDRGEAVNPDDLK